MRACDIFGQRFYFDAFWTVQTNRTCMRIRFDQLSRAFSNRCVFDQNPQRISVDRRPKRIEMYAFSNENALVRTGPRSKTVISGTFPLWNA